MIRTRSRSRNLAPAARLLVLFALVLLSTASARAQVTFTRIADPSTIRPGSGGETFDEFGEGSPVISGAEVSFFGGSASGSGIYVGDGVSVTMIADRSTDDPEGSAETFGKFSDATWIDGPYVAFIGSLLAEPGVYLSDGGSITKVAERGDPVPGSAASFQSLWRPTVSGGLVAFGGEADDGGVGVYLADGSLITIADDSTAIPGGSGETFVAFGDALVSGSEVAFYGDDFGSNRFGLYLGAGGPLTVIADDTTPVPGGAGTFTGIRDYSFDGGVAAFEASSAGFVGIYLGSGGPLTTVADSSTPRPGGGTFGVFDGLSVSGGNVLFVDGGDLFFWEGGEVRRLLGAGDALDGRTVGDLFLGAGALDGLSFTVVVEFTDDSFGIYRGEIASIDIAEVPTLGEWGLILLALSLAAVAAFVLRPTA